MSSTLFQICTYNNYIHVYKVLQTHKLTICVTQVCLQTQVHFLFSYFHCSNGALIRYERHGIRNFDSTFLCVEPETF